MRRSAIALSGIFLVALSFWQLHSASNSFDWLLATNPNFNILRIILGVTLTGYAAISALQQYALRMIIRAFGAVVFLLALNGIFYLTYNDSNGMSMFPLDVVSLMEGAIVAMLASLTVPSEALEDVQEPVSTIGLGRPL